MRRTVRGTAALLVLLAASAAWGAEPAADPASLAAMKAELEAQRQALAAQQRELDEQRTRLQALENRLLGEMRAAGLGSAGAGAQGATAASRGVETVGEKPADADRAPEVAVLADQGGIITRAGRLTIEPNLEYARADRNRFVFRGIEVPQSVLIGVFDINESRQDIVTAALVGRFGVTNRMEVSARVPFVYRKDTSVLVPLVENNQGSEVGTINTSADGSGLGDVELSARYQLTNGTGGWPFLIAGVQLLMPTGKDPFDLRRDALGNATESATGSGFWGVAPSLTVLMPSDPATLFGSLGYTYNFGRDIGVRISNAIIAEVEPGGAPNATVGLGLSLNPALSVSFAYAHTWQFATKTILRPITLSQGVETIGDPITSKSRDLQLGRFLFGISYRTSPRMTINWAVEVGATEDASDVRTTLRIPFMLN